MPLSLTPPSANLAGAADDPPGGGQLLPAAPALPVPSKVVLAANEAAAPGTLRGQYSPALALGDGGRGGPVDLTGLAVALALLLCLVGLSALALWRRLQQLQTTSAQRAEQQAAQSRLQADRLETLFWQSATGLLVCSADGQVQRANPVALRLLGQASPALTGQSLPALLPGLRWPNDVVHQAADMQALLDHHSAGRPQALAVQFSPLPTELGHELLVQLHDLEPQQAAARQLATSQAVADEALKHLNTLAPRLQNAQQRVELLAPQLQAAQTLRDALFNQASTALVLTSADGQVQALNPSAAKLLGSSADKLVGRPLADAFQAGDDRALLAQLLAPGPAAASPLAAAGGEAAPAPSTSPSPSPSAALRNAPRTLHCLGSDRQPVPVSATVCAWPDHEGRPAGWLVSLQDITERLRLAEQLAHLSLHDGLTGLANRRQLEQRLQLAVGQARRHGLPLALLALGINRFKAVNDQFGHAVGDEVLCQVAQRIQSTLRSTDLAARLAGDEFIVVLGTLARLDDVPEVADKLLAVLSEPLQIGPHRILLQASMGVASFPQAGNDTAALLRAAVLAMQESKQAGHQTLRRLGLSG